VDAEIARAVSAFEATGAADPLAMFDHAYATRTTPLEAQRAEMQERLARAPDGVPGPVAPAPPASAAGDAAGTGASDGQSAPMRGQRRPWRS
jgi:hypothetical protein